MKYAEDFRIPKGVAMLAMHHNKGATGYVGCDDVLISPDIICCIVDTKVRVVIDQVVVNVNISSVVVGEGVDIRVIRQTTEEMIL